MLTANVSMEVTAMRRLIIAFMAAVALAGCGSNGSTSAPPGQPGSINWSRRPICGRGAAYRIRNRSSVRTWLYGSRPTLA